MSRMVNRWAICVGTAATVTILGLSGVIAHGLCLIQALPPEVLLERPRFSLIVIPYYEDPDRTITSKDFRKIKDALVPECWIIGLYSCEPAIIPVESPTTVTVEFGRRRTWLSVSLIKTNGVWAVTEVTKETSSDGGSKGYFDQILNGASAVLP